MSPPTTDDRLVGLISQLVSENRLANTIICAKYDPKTNFNHWLSNYEAQCDRLALTINHKKLHIASYLPDETATWVSRSQANLNWSDLKARLKDIYGVSDEKYKAYLRKRLESLKQGNMSSKRFKMLFESIVLDFPTGHCLDVNTLRALYLRCMNPRLRAAVVPNIAVLTSWTKIADAAAQIEDALASDDILLEEAFSQLSLETPPSSSSFDLSVGPSPMEIDTFQRRAGSGCNELFCQAREEREKEPDRN